MKTWTDADFPAMSWHDNSVHGIEVRQEENVFGSLILDLDFIEEWLAPVEGTHHFKITPCILQFHNVTDLVMNLDYRHASASLCPFTIDRIYRKDAPSEDPNLSRMWEIEIIWPIGRLSFVATGFTQTAIGVTVQSELQGLDYKTRKEAKESLNQAL